MRKLSKEQKNKQNCISNKRERYQKPNFPYEYTVDKQTKRVVAPATKKALD